MRVNEFGTGWHIDGLRGARRLGTPGDLMRGRHDSLRILRQTTPGLTSILTKIVLFDVNREVSNAGKTVRNYSAKVERGTQIAKTPTFATSMT